MSNNNEQCCLAGLLKVIEVLQCNAEKADCVSEGCSKPFLGSGGNVVCFNTRPVTFYGCNNNLFTLNYQTVDATGATVNGVSSVFRVEKVDGCCCTVSILMENPVTTDPLRPYVSTNNFATINLKCVCVVKCLPDTIVDC